MENTTPIKTNSTLPSVDSANWGAGEELEVTDLLVPKIYHQQALSKLVKEGKARPGDFCDSLTSEVIVKKEDKLELIIFSVFKTLIVSKYDFAKDKYNYEKTITITPENACEMANKAWVEDIEGEKFKNSLCYNFCCLIPGRLNDLPMVLSLMSTKIKTAKKLATMITKLKERGKPSAFVVFELTNVNEKKDNNDWLGLEVSQGRDATRQELEAAHSWYVRSKSQSFTTIDEEVTGESAESTEDVPF